jgi:hypothetical protein
MVKELGSVGDEYCAWVLSSVRSTSSGQKLAQDSRGLGLISVWIRQRWCLAMTCVYGGIWPCEEP